MQVRHSGNFLHSWPIFTRFMGGINYQIEHHLFPSLSNEHLPRISPIVKQTCFEFGLPYVMVDSAGGVLEGLLETYLHVHD
jgi:linoleoyl-CoA desaturase